VIFRRSTSEGAAERRYTARTVIVAALTTAVIAPVAGAAADATGWTIVPGGGAAHGDAAYCHTCDIIGVRNIQGGSNREHNLDIGAGTTADPGDLSLNYDIGRCTQVWNGQKQPIATFCPDRVQFYAPVEFKQRVRFGGRVIASRRKRPGSATAAVREGRRR
jgi:hypothetical protein